MMDKDLLDQVNRIVGRMDLHMQEDVDRAKELLQKFKAEGFQGDKKRVMGTVGFDEDKRIMGYVFHSLIVAASESPHQDVRMRAASAALQMWDGLVDGRVVMNDERFWDTNDDSAGP